MTAPLSEQQLAEIRALLDGAPAAHTDLLKSIAEAYRDRREHKHPAGHEDWFCTNLAGWMGDRMAVVLSRLLDAEARVAELEAAERTVWRAEHHESGMVLGHYATRQAAMDHIHATLAVEENVTVAAIVLRVIWRADDPDGPEDAETPWECWLSDADTEDDQATSYVVGPIEIETAYDPAGDQ